MTDGGARTEPVDIAVVGDCTLTTFDQNIVIPDHTYLHIFGKVTKTAVNDNFIINSDSVGGNVDIRVYGPGTVDGNVTSGSTGNNCLKFTNVTGLRVDGLNVKRSGQHCIAFDLCSDVMITNNVCSNFGDDGITSLSSTDFVITGNECYTGRGTGTPLSCGIEVEDNSFAGIVSNNIIHGMTGSQKCIHNIVDPTANNYTLANIVVTGNVCIGGANGITLQQNDTDAPKFIGMVITDNTIIDSTGDAITVKNTNDSTIANNTISNSAGTGISTATGSGISLLGNTITTTGDHAISLFQTDAVTISGGSVTDAGGQAGATKNAVQVNDCNGVRVSFLTVTGGSGTNYTNRAVNWVGNNSGLLYATGIASNGITQKGTGMVTNGDSVIGADGGNFDITNVSV